MTIFKAMRKVEPEEAKEVQKKYQRSSTDLVSKLSEVSSNIPPPFEDASAHKPRGDSIQPFMNYTLEKKQQERKDRYERVADELQIEEEERIPPKPILNDSIIKKQSEGLPGSRADRQSVRAWGLA